MNKILFLIIILYLPAQLFGQINYGINRYEVAQGLLASQTFKTVTTSDGKIWLATNSGIIAFNGHTFTNYTHNLNDSNSLSTNYCVNMAVDGKDNLWINADDFLNVFNTKTKKVVRINDSYKSNSLEKVRIIPTCFQYSKTSATMFIGTRSGIYFSRNGDPKIEHISAIDKRFNFKMEIFKITLDEATNTLFFLAENILYSINLNSKELNKIELEKTISNRTIKPNNLYVSCLYAFENTIWAGLSGKGLLEYDRKSKKSRLHVNPVAAKNNISYIAKFENPSNNNNQLYIATNDNGIYSFDVLKKVFNNKHFENSETIDAIYTIFCNNNCIWITGVGGLNKIEFYQKEFEVFEFKLSNNPLNTIIADKVQVERNAKQADEILWVLVGYVGTYRYNLKTKSIFDLPKKAKQFFVHEASILDFLIDKNNYLWVSSVRDGITCYDINNDRVIFKDKSISKNGMIWAYNLHDDFKGNIWFGTPSGLYKFDKHANKIEKETVVNDLLKQNELSLFVESITSDKKGNIWLSVDGLDEVKVAGVVKYNTQIEQATVLFNEKENIPKANAPILLRNIAVTEANELFVIIRGYGLLYFKDAGKTGFEYIAKDNSTIPDLYSNIAVSDKNGNIWCSSDKFVYYYNQKNKDFVKIFLNAEKTENKNISGIDISKNTDALIISSENSIVILPPTMSLQGSSQSKLIFEQLTVFDKLYSTHFETGQTINLDFDQNTITINFALLNYNSSELNKYYWKLSSINKDWQTSLSNFASYNLLPPGKYVFEVKATDNNGLWAKQHLTLVIVINPPFYKTWWFILLCLLVLFGIAYYLYLLKIKRIKNKYALQNKIAADLHDEVGSTLTSISILSKLSQSAIDTSPEQVKEMLAKINTQSATVQQNISDIVWSIRAENKDGDSLVTRFREYAANTLEPLNIEIEFNLNDDLLDRSFSIANKKELLLIFKESINNIVKHANASKVIVSFFQKNKQNLLSIQDNGTWKGNSSGTGSKSITERASILGGTATIEQNEIGTIVIVKF